MEAMNFFPQKWHGGNEFAFTHCTLESVSGKTWLAGNEVSKKL